MNAPAKASIPLSIVLPCLNEAEHVEACIGSVVLSVQAAGIADWELLVADGDSDDGSRQVLERLQRTVPQLQIIDNPQRYVSTGLNRAIARARGRYICRVDAHARYPQDYIGTLMAFAEAHDTDNVGGRWNTVPGDDSATALAIATAMSSRFGVGNSAFRTRGAEAPPCEVDTVPFGFWPASVFDEVGLFDEQLLRNQDNEHNTRLRQAGGRIWLLPSLSIDYLARTRWRQLARMMFQYGLFGPLVDRKLGRLGSARKYAPLTLVGVLLFCLLAALLQVVSVGWFLGASAGYLGIAVSAALVSTPSPPATRRASRLRVAFAYGVMHLCYGTGYLAGIVRFWCLPGTLGMPGALRSSR